MSLITLIPEKYSAWQFWTMVGALILACPFLYVAVPELRHLGRAAWEFYFLPAQTIFYFIIPNPEENKGWECLLPQHNVTLDKPKMSSLSSHQVKRPKILEFLYFRAILGTRSAQADIRKCT